MTQRTKAILFDIDGTLVNCLGAGKRALVEASKSVFGTCGAMETFQFQGRTDPFILREALKDTEVGADTVEENMEKFRDEYTELLSEYIKVSEIIIYPGIVDVLEILSKKDHILLGLLTGNVREGARIKLEACGLNDYFTFGAFGDDSAIRNELPEVAQKRISLQHGLDMDFKDIYIIGDTIHDIGCAKHVGAVSIAVATGWSDIAELRGADPDYCFDNFENYEELLKILED